MNPVVINVLLYLFNQLKKPSTILALTGLAAAAGIDQGVSTDVINGVITVGTIVTVLAPGVHK